MRKIEDVLRLRAAGHSMAEVAQSVHLGQTTVTGYVTRARAAGLSWPLPPELHAERLEGKLFRDSAGDATGTRLAGRPPGAEEASPPDPQAALAGVAR